MSEEEKKAIELLKEVIDVRSCVISDDIGDEDIRIILNLMEKQSKVIDEMAKEILRIDTAKSKFEYDHAKVWDTENGIKKYLYRKVSEEDDN